MPGELADDPPTVGVLMVHGIGSQKFGATLQSNLAHLVDWIDERLDPGTGHVRVGEARLAVHDLPPQTPAHAVLDLVSRNGAAEQPERAREKWIVAESWWAESFRAPGYWSLLSWTLTSAVTTLGLDAGEIYRSITRASAGGSLKARARSVGARLTDLGRLYARVFILAPALTLLITIAVGSFLPSVRKLAVKLQAFIIGSVGDSYALVVQPVASQAIVGRVQRDMHWLADRGARSVVVVAHSQGAEVARLAVARSDIPENINLRLLTYGSGSRKLAALRRLTSSGHAVRHTFFVTISLALVLLGSWMSISVVAAAATRIGSFTDLADEWLTFLGDTDPGGGNAYAQLTILILTGIFGLAAIITVCVIVSRVALAVYTSEPPQDLPAAGGRASSWLLLLVSGAVLATGVAVDSVVVSVLAAQVVVVLIGGWLLSLDDGSDVPGDGRLEPAISADRPWLDVRATADPVASAPAPSDLSESVRRRVIYNLRSPLLDHTSYWKNWVSFVPLVVDELVAVSEWAHRSALTTTPDWRSEQELKQGRRTGILVLFRVAGVVAVIAGLVLFPMLDFGAWLLGFVDVPGTSDLTDGEGSAWLEWSVGAAAASVIGACAYSVIFAGFRGHDRRLRRAALSALREPAPAE